MKKVLCTAVVLAMGLPAIAHAEAQLYGKIRAFVGEYDNGANSEWKASSESSRLGFKGSSDLEHDLEVIYQLEYQINYMWGKPGVLRKLLPSYFKYYSPNFHPWDHDARGLVEKAKRKWLAPVMKKAS